MIRVTVELLPQGNPHRAKTLGVLEITNDVSSHDKDWGNYNVIMTDFPDDRHIRRTGGRVHGHHREAPIWKLVERAINTILSQRMPTRMRPARDRHDKRMRQSAPQCRLGR